MTHAARSLDRIMGNRNAAPVAADRRSDRKPPGGDRLFDQIKAGSRVTIVTPQGQKRTGRAVMYNRQYDTWVLNMGGKHGTPGIASDKNVVKVSGAAVTAGTYFIVDKKTGKSVEGPFDGTAEADKQQATMGSGFQVIDKKFLKPVSYKHLEASGQSVDAAPKQGPKRKGGYLRALKDITLEYNFSQSNSILQGTQGRARLKKGAIGRVAKVSKNPGNYLLDMGPGYPVDMGGENRYDIEFPVNAKNFDEADRKSILRKRAASSWADTPPTVRMRLHDFHFEPGKEVHDGKSVQKGPFFKSGGGGRKPSYVPAPVDFGQMAAAIKAALAKGDTKKALAIVSQFPTKDAPPSILEALSAVTKATEGMLEATEVQASPVLSALDAVTSLQSKLLDDTKPVKDSPVLSALAKVTEATESLVTKPKAVKAAKDTGSSKKDKDRAAKVQTMVAKADELKEGLDLASFPEAKAACDAVTSLKDMSTKLAEAQIKLKAAPGKTEEADQAQVTLDSLRENLDTMIPPLEATLKTMETLLLAAAALEEQFAMMSEEVAGLEEKLKSDKERLAAISKAVEQAAKIG